MAKGVFLERGWKREKQYRGKYVTDFIKATPEIAWQELAGKDYTCNLEKAKNLLKQGAEYVARFDEHGHLFYTEEWIEFCAWAKAHRKVVLNLDFGYIDHYDRLLVDVYGEHGKSIVAREFPRISEEVTEPSYLDYKKKHAEDLRLARELGPLEGTTDGGYYAVWVSWNVDLMRAEIPSDNDSFTYEVYEKVVLGTQKRIVIKAPPQTFVKMRPHVPVFRGRDRVENLRIGAHAHGNIIVNSSVSCDLALAGFPVTALGRSWFNGLNVFYEPKSWDYAMVVQKPNAAQVNKWINWWALHTASWDSSRDIQEKVELARLRAEKYVWERQ